jgi:hypothetical protein
MLICRVDIVHSIRTHRGPIRLMYQARGEVDGKTLRWLAIAGVVVAVGLLVYVSASGRSDAVLHEDMHLKCKACGHEFTRAVDDATRERASVGDARADLQCPKCSKRAGATMMQCEKCTKYYPGGAFRARKCPHCGFNPDQ